MEATRCGCHPSSPTCGDPAPEHADGVQRTRGADLGQEMLVHHRVLAEGGAAHEMVNGAAVLGEPGAVVCQHHPSTNRAHGLHAQVGALVGAQGAFGTCAHEIGDDMVARCELRHLGTHALHNPI